MIFTELTEEEFRNFAANHELKSFIQTPELGSLKKNQGFDIYYVGVKESDKIVAATFMMSSASFLGKKIFYAPNGYLIDFENESILNFFTKEIKKYIKSKKGFVLTIDPYFETKQLDIDGNVVPNGYDNTKKIELLKKIGYIYTGKTNQLKYLFSLEIENKVPEKLLSEMKNNTRKFINKSLQKCISVRELEYDELNIFKSLTDATSNRKSFSNKSLTYYQEMYKLYKPLNQVKYLIAEVNLEEYIEELKLEIENYNQKILKVTSKKNNEKEMKEYTNKIIQLNEKINEVKKIKDEKGNKIITSGAMFIIYGDEIIYLFGGNYKEYLNFYAQYRLQWEMIKYASLNKYKRYNFYGISTLDPNSPDYGVYKFKRGFNGHVMEMVGQFELKISIFYDFYKIIKKILKK